MLGIIIGVGAVIALVSIGHGARAAVSAQVASMGTNVIIILPGATTVGGVRGGQGGAVTLTVSDALELKKKIPLLSETAWAKRDVMQIVYGNRNWNGPVNGISPGYLTIRDWSYMSGGPITQADVDSAARVALVGQTVVENLFEAGEEPVGATIRIKNVPFRVIGVLAPKGQSAQGSDQDDIIFIPFTTAERKVLGTLFLGSRQLTGRRTYQRRSKPFGRCCAPGTGSSPTNRMTSPSAPKWISERCKRAPVKPSRS
jgi:putative ABC transport system permease protein